MPKTAETVDAYMARLVHARKAEVEALRAIVMAADPGISERIKWNAPSFCADGVDRVTMRLQPRDVVQLVFHRGAKPRDTAGFAFEDPTGLLVWAAPDRATLTFSDKSDVEARREALGDLVRAWISA